MTITKPDQTNRLHNARHNGRQAVLQHDFCHPRGIAHAQDETSRHRAARIPRPAAPGPATSIDFAALWFANDITIFAGSWSNNSVASIQDWGNPHPFSPSRRAMSMIAIIRTANRPNSRYHRSICRTLRNAPLSIDRLGQHQTTMKVAANRRPRSQDTSVASQTRSCRLFAILLRSTKATGFRSFAAPVHGVFRPGVRANAPA